jgi:hypothetical protein
MNIDRIMVDDIKDNPWLLLYDRSELWYQDIVTWCDEPTDEQKARHILPNMGWAIVKHRLMCPVGELS